MRIRIEDLPGMDYSDETDMTAAPVPPTHPGEILAGLWLEPLGLSVTNAAAKLNVSRITLSMIINGRGQESIQKWPSGSNLPSARAPNRGLLTSHLLTSTVTACDGFGCLFGHVA